MIETLISSGPTFEWYLICPQAQQEIIVFIAPAPISIGEPIYASKSIDRRRYYAAKVIEIGQTVVILRSSPSEMTYRPGRRIIALEIQRQHVNVMQYHPTCVANDGCADVKECALIEGTLIGLFNNDYAALRSAKKLLNMGSEAKQMLLSSAIGDDDICYHNSIRVRASELDGPHRFKVPLPPVDTDRQAVFEREVLRVLR